MIETWALEKLNPLCHERLVTVHDPQRMIRRGAAVVDGWAVQHGFTVIFPSGNLGFRDQYEQIRDNADLKVILRIRGHVTSFHFSWADHPSAA